MKSSLISATSFGALLVFELIPSAQAQIFTLNNNSQLGFGDQLVNCAAFSGCTVTGLSETATINVTSSYASTLVFGSATTPYRGGTTKTYTSLASGSTTATLYTFAPTIAGASSASVSVVATYFTNAGKTKVVQTSKLALAGTGVAPLQSVTNTNNGYVLVTNSDTATVTVANTGNGNLATNAPTSVSNLNGSISGQTLGTGYSGSSTGSFSLNDSTYTGTGAVTSNAYTYTFAPTAKGQTASTTVNISFTNGNNTGATAGTNTADNATVTLTGTGVAPVATMTGGGNYALVGNSSAIAVTVQNTGNGNLSGAGTISNLQGTVLGASGLFSGSSIALTTGSTLGLLDNGSQAISYTFAPSSIGTFSTSVTGTFSNGIGNGNASGTESATLTGTGVAPISSVSQTNPTYVLVNSAANSKAATVTVSDIGNGDLAGADSPTLQTNLHGSVGSSSSVFTGAGGSINLQDSNATTAAGFPTSGATTATYTYNFAPTITGAASATVTATFTNSSGSTGAYATGTTTVTLTATGVAPTEQVGVTNAAGSGGQANTGNLGYLLVGSQTATATVTQSDVGNGNLAGTGGAFNLNGSITNAQGSGFSGGTTGSTISLQDSHAGTGSTTASFTYTFAPSVRGSATTVVTSSFSNGSNDGLNNAASAQTTLTATGVAPIQSVSSSNAIARVNAYGEPNSNTGTAMITVQNVGNGNLAGTGGDYNLNGSVTNTLGNGFTGGTVGTSISLLDSNAAGGPTTSSYTYTFAPTARGVATTTVNVAFSNGDSAGTNLSQSVAANVIGTGVGPTYQSAVSTTANVDTPMINGGTAQAASISFGTVGHNMTDVVNLYISNITTDPDAGNPELTTLSINTATIGGGNDVSAFQIGAFNGTEIAENAADPNSIDIQITLTANSYGSLTSYLVLNTDENAPFQANGDTFYYALNAYVPGSSESAAPEPASMAMLGAGLVGLGWARRRRSR